MKADVPKLPVRDYCNPNEFLLLASYCGVDNPRCTEERPCHECLSMCNIFGPDGNFLREFGDAL